jgi:hypothetical protein
LAGFAVVTFSSRVRRAFGVSSLFML